ncbi:MAG: NAD(P)/FAD-dependent oxidoreductase [Pseudomonadota bacterium]
MNRREFAKLSAGFALAAPSLVHAQQTNSVIVIGAGAAGLTSAYHLKKAGISIQVLEASNRSGGRVKRLTGFEDVALDLGAEWIHGEDTLLGEILGQGETNPGVETIAFDPQTYQFWNNGRLKDFNIARNFYAETKFRDTSWYGFFERFVLPSINGSIELNTPVSHIDSDGDGVTIRSASGQSFTADRVIVTVPISILRDRDITFSSQQATRQMRDLNDVTFGKGYKVFLSFQERFYPDMLFFGSRAQAFSTTYDSKIYYDAAFKKPTKSNILGLFNVDHDTLPRVDLSDTQIIEEVLTELTEAYGPEVRSGFIKAKVQNWNAEPFIRGSYSMTNKSDADLSDILAPIESKIFFAGEALGGDYQSTVHGAAFSAIEAIEMIYS